MPSKRPPARVHIILARNADTAIVIRRGPSKSVCTLEWDRKQDLFRMGQWLRGRIYERRCDLSPDGRYFIYFAMNGKWDSEAKGSWTAISKAPYLKAVGLWANGSCWNGGGLFMTNRHCWLNAFMFGHQSLQEPPGLTKHEGHPFHEGYGGECLPQNPALRKRLLKDRISMPLLPPVFDKCYYDTHEIVHSERERTLECVDWEWADLDAERVVWVSKGVLYGAKLTSKGLGPVRTLHDFNPLEFEPIKAPY